MGAPIAKVLAPAPIAAAEQPEAKPESTKQARVAEVPAPAPAPAPVAKQAESAKVVEEPQPTVDVPVAEVLTPVVEEPAQLTAAVDKLSLAAEPAPVEDKDAAVSKAAADAAAGEAPAEEAVVKKKPCPCCAGRAKAKADEAKEGE